ncbi:hypothetical protein [Kineococcus rhizosphaerae]|uniref:hypothetical protein n=1 Tax=Kineococcus rhizosphaerae TaxID=559628 RepID=UPI001FE3BA5C|nr:hypothetical protein [Kineococcus rhizosphaerae]
MKVTTRRCTTACATSSSTSAEEGGRLRGAGSSAPFPSARAVNVTVRTTSSMRCARAGGRTRRTFAVAVSTSSRLVGPVLDRAVDSRAHTTATASSSVNINGGRREERDSR